MLPEEEDFNPKKPSKLASIFGSSNNKQSDGSIFDKNKHSKYTETINNSPNSFGTKSQATSLALIIVKVIQAHVLKNNKFEHQGKLAAALLGNFDIKHYQIIIYKDKNNHITKTFFTPIFWFGAQENNFASFYDFKNDIWSIQFNNSSDFIEFSTQVILSKWICSTSRNELIVQDLITPKAGKQIKLSDNVKINYIVSYLDEKCRIIKKETIKGTKNIKLTLKDSWENTLLNAVDNSRKLVILPKHLAYVWEKEIGKRCHETFGLLLDLAIEFDISATEIDKEIKLPNIEMVLPKLPFDVTDKDTVNTVDNQNKIDTPNVVALESSSMKSDLLIADMGRLAKPSLSALSNIKSTSLDSVDTEEDSSSTNSSSVTKNQKKTKPRLKQKLVGNQPLVNQQIQPISSFYPSYTQQHIMPGAMIGYQGYHSFGSVAVSSIIDGQLPVVYSELRTNNSELRMGLNSLTDKADRIIDKVQNGIAIKEVIQQVVKIKENVEKRLIIIRNENNLSNDYSAENFQYIWKLPNSYSEMTKNTEESSDEIKNQNEVLSNSLIKLNSRIEEIEKKITECEIENKNLEGELSKEREANTELRCELLNETVNLRNGDSYKTTLDSSLENWLTKAESVRVLLDELSIDIEGADQRSNEVRKMDSQKVLECMNSLYKLLKSEFKPNTNYCKNEISDVVDNLFKLNGLNLTS